jgi:VCBS repeat-containing protein
VTPPSHASSFTLNADGSFSYTPVSNYSGPDSFTYKANDGSLDSNIATVSITVTPINDPPVATDDVADDQRGPGENAYPSGF